MTSPTCAFLRGAALAAVLLSGTAGAIQQTVVELISTSGVTGTAEHGFGFSVRGINSGLTTFPGLNGLPGDGDFGDGLAPDSGQMLMVAEPFPNSAALGQAYGLGWWSLKGTATVGHDLVGHIGGGSSFNETEDRWGFSADTVAAPLSVTGQAAILMGNPTGAAGNGAVRMIIRVPANYTIPGFQLAFDFDSANSGEGLGHSLALLGDMDTNVSPTPDVTLDGVEGVLGAPMHSSGGAANTGRITVYRFPDSNSVVPSLGDATPDHVQQVGENAGDRFGSSVVRLAAQAELAWFLVGAPGYDGTAGTDTGKIYLYRLDVSIPDGAYTLTEVATEEGEAPFDHFGGALGQAGDLDGTAATIEVLVGAAEFGVSGSGTGETGRVYGYQFVPSSESFTPIFTLDGETDGDLFGSALAVVGNLDGAGNGDFLVGAPGYDPVGLPGAGKTYAFSWDGIPLSAPSAVFGREGTIAGEGFGWSVTGLGAFDEGSVGDGTFGAVPEATAHGAASVTGLAAADFTNDGAMDLVIADGIGSNVLVYSATGALFGDVDGLLGVLGDGGFFEFPVNVGAGQGGVATGNWVTSSATPDLLVSLPSTDSVILIDSSGLAQGPAVTVGTGPTAVAAGFWDVDTILDAAVIDALGGTVSILKGDGSDTLAVIQTLPLTGGHLPTALAVSDWDGSGFSDLLVSCTTNEVHALQNDGAGTFADIAQSATGGTTPTTVVMGLFDAGSDLDAALAHGVSNDLTILLGDGAGTFTDTGSPVPLGAQALSLAAGDFNEDGEADLAVGTDGAPPGRILIGAGDGTFSLSSLGTTGTINRILVGDFVEDGVTDVVMVGLSSIDTHAGNAIGPGTGDQWVAAGAPFSEGTTPNIVNKGVVRLMKLGASAVVAPLVMGFDKDMVSFCHEGASLTIKGQGLQGGAVILVDGQPLTHVLIDPKTGDLTGLLPSFGAPGIKSIEVVNPDGGSLLRQQGLWVTPSLEGSLVGSSGVGGSVQVRLTHHEPAVGLLLVGVGADGAWLSSPATCYQAFLPGTLAGLLPLGVVGAPAQGAWTWEFSPLPGSEGMVVDLQTLVLPVSGGAPAFSNLVQVRL